MELFDRIRYIASEKDISLAKIAKCLDIPQQTFHQWLKLGSQKNLWEHLPKILEMFPDIRPEWLYRDIGPACDDGTGPERPLSPEIVALHAKVEELEAELREAYRTNQRLTTRLLVDGVGDKSDATNTVGKAAGGQG